MWAVLSVATLCVAVGVGQVVLTLAARDRLAHDASALHDAEEDLAVQQQIAHTGGLDLDPHLSARLTKTCTDALTRYNHDAPAARHKPLNPAAHCH
jgi:hypothetical protein